MSELEEMVQAAVNLALAESLSTITKQIYAILAGLGVIIAGGAAWVTTVNMTLRQVQSKLEKLPPDWLVRRLDDLAITDRRLHERINKLASGDNE